jgi:hypothetical protein
MQGKRSIENRRKNYRDGNSNRYRPAQFRPKDVLFGDRIVYPTMPRGMKMKK